MTDKRTKIETVILVSFACAWQWWFPNAEPVEGPRGKLFETMQAPHSHKTKKRREGKLLVVGQNLWHQDYLVCLQRMLDQRQGVRLSGKTHIDWYAFGGCIWLICNDLKVNGQNYGNAMAGAAVLVTTQWHLYQTKVLGVTFGTLPPCPNWDLNLGCPCRKTKEQNLENCNH